MIMASPHFSIDELTFSETATRHGIDNTATGNALDNIYKTAKEMENVRELLDNKPIFISSGYRCLALNELLKSKSTSAHIQGLAVDFTCRQYGAPKKIMDVIVKSEIQYNQVILEYDRWIHIAFCKYKETPKKEALVINNNGVFQLL
tara:strand:- start:135 stop:575 length:441 start_codon:yes stop_codon:yes gene_type:complete